LLDLQLKYKKAYCRFSDLLTNPDNADGIWPPSDMEPVSGAGPEPARVSKKNKK
jgi:hypothetical protein